MVTQLTNVQKARLFKDHLKEHDYLNYEKLQYYYELNAHGGLASGSHYPNRFIMVMEYVKQMVNVGIIPANEGWRLMDSFPLMRALNENDFYTFSMFFNGFIMQLKNCSNDVENKSYHSYVGYMLCELWDVYAKAD